MLKVLLGIDRDDRRTWRAGRAHPMSYPVCARKLTRPRRYPRQLRSGPQGPFSGGD